MEFYQKHSGERGARLNWPRGTDDVNIAALKPCMNMTMYDDTVAASCQIGTKNYE